VWNEDAGFIGAAINVVQEVRSIDQADRIARAVDPEAVNRALVDGIAATLGAGPPFAFTDGPTPPATLQVEVLSYGLTVPYLGAPGQFTYTARVRLYKANGDRIYKKRLTCTAGVGNPSAPAVVLGAVDNVRQLNHMTDEQIHQAFEAIARYCGQELVVKLRKHAG
jgi:hypothetical protein